MGSQNTQNGSIADHSKPVTAESRETQRLRERLDPARMPEHVAVIMDGNGRWARKHHLPSRLLGHREGYKTTKKIVRAASDLGVKYLTLYVFSNENWRRPKHETDGLMTLIEHATRTELLELHENGIRMRFLGRRAELTPSLRKEIERAEALTENNPGLVLNLALNYGGRAEIVDAVRKLAEAAVRGEIDPAKISEEDVSAHLYAPEMPDPDLLIRTAGELRVSNFLLWEIAYSEMWVTPTLWPDFSAEHLVQAIEDYQMRVRKFGAVVNP
ncbi:MAG: isoprenyl transferase [Capsulimonas sp.]|uniref:isoprenyl transferase n=1 Tax=Capsulimonas sp. TaxID=2494211 RepID=UPI0032646EEA